MPGLLVEERPAIVDGIWTLGVTLPDDIDVRPFLAGTVAECVPWLTDDVPGFGLQVPGRVRVPFEPGYSDEEQEQLVLVAAKVLHYLRQGQIAPAQSHDRQDAGAAMPSTVEAAAEPA